MADDAPLIETADAKAPPGRRGGWYAGAGGAKLRAALFTPPRRAGRGSIVLSGGRTEPIEKYYEVIGELLDRGFVVLAHDWRGQGLSRRELPDPLKGHAKGFKPYLDDFRALLDAYAERLPKPWVGGGPFHGRLPDAAGHGAGRDPLRRRDLLGADAGPAHARSRWPSRDC